jgi:hypothetical protein
MNRRVRAVPRDSVLARPLSLLYSARFFGCWMLDAAQQTPREKPKMKGRHTNRLIMTVSQPRSVRHPKYIVSQASINLLHPPNYSNHGITPK